MKEQFLERAKSLSVDIVGFAPASRFEKDDAIFKIFPQTKTVIGLAFRVLRGVYRGIEEGTTYHHYATMGIENLEEVMMPIALLGLSQLLEENGYTAVPQKLHQNIMAEENSTNPETEYRAIARGIKGENQLDFTKTAIKCGLGELGLSGKVLTDDFGPFVRYCFILTDAEFEATPLYEKHLCDNCMECVKGCPGKAISEDGTVDKWQCAVYYKGANGTRNPFLEPDAYSDYPNRMEILSGEFRAGENLDMAKEIMNDSVCYPPIPHFYLGCVCGKSCEVDCYVHLEEKGLIKKKYDTKFRKREKWSFPLEDYKLDKQKQNN